MGGFIDRDASTKRRLDRMEALLAELVPLLPEEAFSPRVREIADDLLSEDALRQERGRRRPARLEGWHP